MAPTSPRADQARAPAVLEDGDHHAERGGHREHVEQHRNGRDRDRAEGDQHQQEGQHQDEDDDRHDRVLQLGVEVLGEGQVAADVGLGTGHAAEGRRDDVRAERVERARGRGVRAVARERHARSRRRPPRRGRRPRSARGPGRWPGPASGSASTAAVISLDWTSVCLDHDAGGRRTAGEGRGDAVVALHDARVRGQQLVQAQLLGVDARRRRGEHEQERRRPAG